VFLLSCLGRLYISRNFPSIFINQFVAIHLFIEVSCDSFYFCCHKLSFISGSELYIFLFCVSLAKILLNFLLAFKFIYFFYYLILVLYFIYYGSFILYFATFEPSSYSFLVSWEAELDYLRFFIVLCRRQLLSQTSLLEWPSASCKILCSSFTFICLKIF
jgi:hypothetical protein